MEVEQKSRRRRSEEEGRSKLCAGRRVRGERRRRKDNRCFMRVFV
jgi:hypothetical protein